MPSDMNLPFPEKEKGVQTIMVRRQKKGKTQTYMHFLYGSIYLN